MEDLGKKVAYYRKSKGLSIKSLAENLCDDSTIYRLEQGKQLPRLEILNDICMKLEIPFKSLFPFNEEVDALKKLCRESIYKEDFLSLELILEECTNVLRGLTSIYSKAEFSKFIKWHSAVLLYKKENRDSDALAILNNLVSLKNASSELDIGIMNSIGLIYLSRNNVDASHKIYKVIYKKIKNQKNLEDFTLIPRVGYNYAYAMIKMEQYEDGLKIALEILYYVETHHLVYLLGEIYHMIGILSKKNGDLLEAQDAFKNAILVFTLTKDKINLEKTKGDLLKIEGTEELNS